MRLIDANATVELLRSLGNRDYRREKGTIADAMKMLSHPAYTPTVDAVPVVRCKDCEYWENGKDYEPYCNYWEGMLTDTQADDFCSRGERRADA